MKYIKFFILIFFPVITFAQGGSVYTRYGFGDVFYSHSASRAALGDLGIGMHDRENLSYINPASWSRIKFTRFQASVDFNGINAATELNKAFYSNAVFTGFMVGIPVEKQYGITAVGGIVPVTNVRYEINSDIVNSETPYSRNFKGTGGISKLFLGSSYTLPYDFTIGASLEYYIGTVNHYSNIIFPDPIYTGTSYRRTYKVNGIGSSMGLISNDFSKILGVKPITGLRFGLSYTIPSKFHADSSLITEFSNSEEIILVSSESDANYPAAFGAGMSLELNKNYTVVIDYYSQSWSNFKFNGNKLVNLRDIKKISSGVEYKKADPSSIAFWDNVSLRAGVSYENTQYIINGEGINQLSFNGGVSLPLDQGNSVDIGLQYGIRGTKEFNLVKENIFKINVGISLGEPWFIR